MSWSEKKKTKTEKISHAGKMSTWHFSTRVFYTVATELLIMLQKVFFLIIGLKIVWESQTNAVFHKNINFINNT